MKTPIWKEKTKKKKYKVHINYFPEHGEPFEWVINDLDSVQEVLGQFVCYRDDCPCKGIKKSWLIPCELMKSIEEYEC